MDPDATWAIITDESNDLDERAVAATDLLVWLAKGGATPSQSPWRTDTIETCQHRIFKALDKLAELESADEDRQARIADSKTRHPAGFRQ